MRPGNERRTLHACGRLADTSRQLLSELGAAVDRVCERAQRLREQQTAAALEGIRSRG